MANIPVERKGGTPWWTWLLAVLAIIGLIWLIAELLEGEPDEDDLATDDVGVVEEPMEQPEPMDADAEITSFAELADGTALIGREVNLDGMNVFTLTGDSSFFVGPSADPNEGALVVLQGLNESESLPPPPTGRDGEYNVDEGDVVDIDGVIAAFDETVPDYADMPAEDRDRAMRGGVYINANNIEGVDDTDVETPTQ